MTAQKHGPDITVELLRDLLDHPYLTNPVLILDLDDEDSPELKIVGTADDPEASLIVIDRPDLIDHLAEDGDPATITDAVLARYLPDFQSDLDKQYRGVR